MTRLRTMLGVRMTVEESEAQRMYFHAAMLREGAELEPDEGERLRRKLAAANAETIARRLIGRGEG